jgi:hypothetical protein
MSGVVVVYPALQKEFDLEKQNSFRSFFAGVADAEVENVR